MSDTRSSRSTSSPATSSVAAMSAFWRSLGELSDSFLHLVTLEAKQAAISALFMLGFGVAAAVLILTGWLALTAWAVIALIQLGIVDWGAALILAAFFNFLGAAGLVVLLQRRTEDLLFKATRRQLRSFDSSSSSVVDHDHENPG